MAHQQGLAAALKILTADRNSSIEDVVGASAARHNAMGGMTVALAIGKFDALVRSNEDEARNLLTVGTPTSAVTGRIPAGAAPTQFPISASHFLHLHSARSCQSDEQPARRAARLFRSKRNGAPDRRSNRLLPHRRGQEQSGPGAASPEQVLPIQTDLVIEASVGKLKVIGSNLNDTILTQTVKLDADGRST